MLKRLIACVLLVLVVFGVRVTAFAFETSEPTLTHEVARSHSLFFVNELRIPLRAYSIAGEDFVDIFDLANALANTDAYFFPKWNIQNYSIRIMSGQVPPHLVLGSSVLTPAVSVAHFADVDVVFDSQRFNIGAYRVRDSVYFSLHQLAALLDIGIFAAETGNVVDLVLDMTFTESLTESINESLSEGTAEDTSEAPASIRAINPFRPMIALTFDDGPSIHTIPILDALEYHGVVATFYVTANRLENYRDIAIRTHMMGNEIANHTWSHPRLPHLSWEEIFTELHESNIAIAEITGTVPASFRPTFGFFDSRVEEIARDLGLPLILWSLDTNDWYTRDVNSTFNIVMNNVRDRDIILLHDLHEPTARATVLLIPALLERGFQLVTVSELFYYSGVTPQPGGVYNCGNGMRTWR
ncbi:MAG: polysaccharide deacetylase family protein [Oscillospiraceae bacterium]|nr:polysaccharide deacetylase family protein [Oscillospiraceae bacterium]MCL2248351.1 polysaccharide deacetylase family protein [Oscillospiraceae bacterium]